MEDRHDDFDKTPRSGLELIFDSLNLASFYIQDNFSMYYTSHHEEFMEKLIRFGLVKTVAKLSSFGGAAEQVQYIVNCHGICELLGLIERAPISYDIKYYTINEVATMLSVTRPTVYNLINSGLLKTNLLAGIKGQRISSKALKDYLAIPTQ